MFIQLVTVKIYFPTRSRVIIESIGLVIVGYVDVLIISFTVFFLLKAFRGYVQSRSSFLISLSVFFLMDNNSVKIIFYLLILIFLIIYLSLHVYEEKKNEDCHFSYLIDT